MNAPFEQDKRGEVADQLSAVYKSRGSNPDAFAPRLRELLALCPRDELDDLKDHLLRLHNVRNYFATFDVSAIVDHLKLLRDVNEQKPVRVVIWPSDGTERIHLAIAGLDGRGVCAVVTGVLAQFKLDIRHINVVTYRKTEEAGGKRTDTEVLKYIMDFDVVSELPSHRSAFLLEQQLQGALEQTCLCLGQGDPDSPLYQGRRYFPLFGLGVALFCLILLISRFPLTSLSLSKVLSEPNLYIFLSAVVGTACLIWYCADPAVDRYRREALLRQSQARRLWILFQSHERFLKALASQLPNETEALGEMETLRKLAYLAIDPESGNRTCAELASLLARKSNSDLTSTLPPGIMAASDPQADQPTSGTRSEKRRPAKTETGRMPQEMGPRGGGDMPPAPEAGTRTETGGAQSPLDATELAFLNDLPELLQTHRGQWVAYRGGTQFDFSRSNTDLHCRCLDAGMAEDEFEVFFIDESSRSTVQFLGSWFAIPQP